MGANFTHVDAWVREWGAARGSWGGGAGISTVRHQTVGSALNVRLEFVRLQNTSFPIQSGFKNITTALSSNCVRQNETVAS